MDRTSTTVIIVAGGTGTRMNSDVPKQFLPIAGRPVLMHSLQAFYDAIPDISIVVALPAGQRQPWTGLCQQHNFTIPHMVVDGGTTRFHSVKNALAATTNQGLVAIHDGARPLVTVSLIREAFSAAARYGNAIPAVPLTESAREAGKAGKAGNRVMDRSTIRIIQTPQVFLAAVIRKAYEQAYRDDFTDDATVAEAAGETIHLIEGERANIKITHPDDLTVAGALLLSR